jgi:hypothetical protein
MTPRLHEADRIVEVGRTCLEIVIAGRVRRGSSSGVVSQPGGSSAMSAGSISMTPSVAQLIKACEKCSIGPFHRGTRLVAMPAGFTAITPGDTIEPPGRQGRQRVTFRAG